MYRREFNKNLIAAMAVAATPIAFAADSGRAPTVTGPVTGGKRGYPFTSYLGDLEALGYVEEEFFIEGKATAYTAKGELGEDGMWSLEPGSQHDYRTRFVVQRPADKSNFNGTVLVEWLNVTLGHDIAVTGFLSNTIYEQGIVYVLATCQRVGVEGAGEQPQGLKQWDPERYGSLNIPGDSVSFDILSQVGLAVGPAKTFKGVDPLRGLQPKTVLATGASQSAGRLRSYINGVHPLVNIYNGYLPTIDFGMGFGFADFELNPDNPESARRFLRSKVREDIGAPVFVVNSETESLMHFPSHRPDSSNYRYWEVTGSSHSPGANARKLNVLRERDGLAGMNTEYGSEVMWEPCADAALLHLIKWAQTGTLPPSAPKIQVKVGQMPEVVRDANGNALGGLRLPDVDVPVATYTAAILGFNSPLGLRGKTEPFSDEKLRELYPSRGDYVARVTAAAQQAEKAGYLLPGRVTAYIEEAKKTPLGR